jgi:hypothetical protein
VRRVVILRSGAIERVVFEVRTEIANTCLEMADKNGETPLSALS